MSRQKINTPAALAVSALLLIVGRTVDAQEPASPRTGREVYESVCAACHGPDGRGGVNSELEKIVKPPISPIALSPRVNPTGAFSPSLTMADRW